MSGSRLHTEGHWYQGVRGTRLWHLWRRHPAPKGGVLICHGYGEHSGRYLHVMEALGARGFTVAAPDHRGHGRSARIPGDLESVEWITEDLLILADRLQRSVGDRPIFLLGHSMGAMLALLALAQEPRWAGAILNGAALQIPNEVSLLNLRAAQLLGRVLPLLPLQRFYDPTRSSRDPEVIAWSRADPFQYRGRIRAGTGRQVLAGMRRAMAVAPSIRAPVLVTHGSADRTVPPAISARLHSALGSTDKELQLFDGLLHEVHQEPEREAVLARWGIWLTRRL